MHLQIFIVLFVAFFFFFFCRQYCREVSFCKRKSMYKTKQWIGENKRLLILSRIRNQSDQTEGENGVGQNTLRTVALSQALRMSVLSYSPNGINWCNACLQKAPAGTEVSHGKTKGKGPTMRNTKPGQPHDGVMGCGTECLQETAPTHQ